MGRFNFESGGADYSVVTGEVTLDGGNPTSVATGLSTIEAASVAWKRTDAPALDPHLITVNWAATGGQLDVYAWKPTASGDCTMIASTDSSEVVSYWAMGRK